MIEWINLMIGFICSRSHIDWLIDMIMMNVCVRACVRIHLKWFEWWINEDVSSTKQQKQAFLNSLSVKLKLIGFSYLSVSQPLFIVEQTDDQFRTANRLHLKWATNSLVILSYQSVRFWPFAFHNNRLSVHW